jgi:hypothetical protein
VIPVGHCTTDQFAGTAGKYHLHLFVFHVAVGVRVSTKIDIFQLWNAQLKSEDLVVSIDLSELSSRRMTEFGQCRPYATMSNGARVECNKISE